MCVCVCVCGIFHYSFLSFLFTPIFFSLRCFLLHLNKIFTDGSTNKDPSSDIAVKAEMY